MLRGNNGQPIFFDDTDRYKMCLLIQEGIERYGHRVLAFCFMSNHGFEPDSVKGAYSEISSIPGLSIVALMTIGPLTEDTASIRKSFAQLREIRDALGLFHLSMGMSHDYRIAIEEGATLLRIGTAILGGRHWGLS